MLSRHVLTISYFQILIKSCSIEYRNDPSPKSEVVHETKFSLKISYSTHACLTQLDQHQTCKVVMVSVVSSNPTGCNFIFLRHLDANFVRKWQKCQICVIYKNLDWDSEQREGKANTEGSLHDGVQCIMGNGHMEPPSEHTDTTENIKYWNCINHWVKATSGFNKWRQP